MIVFRRFPRVLLAGLVLAACQDERGSDPECGEDDDILTVDVVARDGGKPVTKELLVEGNAVHAEDMAIHSVTVLGRRATNVAFNFSEWSITLPFEALQELEEDASGMVALTTVVTDTCGNELTHGDTRVVVDPFAGVSATGLSLDVTYADGTDFVPTEISQGATLTVSSDSTGAGAEVELEGVGVLFDGKTQHTVVLDENAQRTVVVSAQQSGNLSILATSEQAPDAAPVVVTLRAVGPPRLIPVSQSVAPGQPNEAVSVLADGTRPTCEANVAAGLGASIGGQDLGTTPVDLGADDATIVIEVDPAAVEPSSMKITCVDDYGQSSSATINLEP